MLDNIKLCAHCYLSILYKHKPCNSHKIPCNSIKTSFNSITTCHIIKDIKNYLANAKQEHPINTQNMCYINVYMIK